MIVWVDTETTGLDPERGSLLEVAFVVTTDRLEEIAYTSALVEPFDYDDIVTKLDPAVRAMHEKNGLLREVEALGGEGCGATAVATRLIRWLINVVDLYVASGGYVDAGGSEPGEILKGTPLAGSTVGFDRAWLRRHMPSLEALFSYRSIDVSSFTEIAKRWSPAVYEGRPKTVIAHRALTDVRESINYLRYYRESGFVGGIK